MASFIIIDPNNFSVELRTSLDAPFSCTEETVAIRKKAEEIQVQMKEFIANKHNPLVQELMKMVEEYNAKANPEWAAKQQLEKNKEADKLSTQAPLPKKNESWADKILRRDAKKKRS